MVLNEQELLIEKLMQTAFWQQAGSLPGLHDAARPIPKVTNAGGEIELFLFTDGGQLATDEQKRQVLEKTNAGIELGAPAVEIHPDPVDLTTAGFTGWKTQLGHEQDLVVESAKNQMLFVGRSGTIPWLPLSRVERTNEEKYRKVPDFHDRHRSFLSPMQIGPIRLQSAAEVGGISSFQFSVEASDAADSVDKLNRMFLISPLVSALSSNARIIDGRDTGWADTRFEVWRQTHDTRSLKERGQGKTVRVGLPHKYPHTLFDYLSEVSSHPFILDKPEHALTVGIGLSWRDARIKVIGNKFVVEFRPISTQPTLKEDLALASFTIGRLLWSQQQNEELPDISKLHQNKASTERFGINARLMTSDRQLVQARRLLPVEIDRAREGLHQADIFDDTAEKGLELLRQRVEQGRTPDRLLRTLSPSQLIDAVKIL